MQVFQKGCENLNILYVCHFWEKGYKFSNKRCGNLNTYRYCRYVCLKKRNASFPKRGMQEFEYKVCRQMSLQEKRNTCFQKRMREFTGSASMKIRDANF